MSPPGLAGDGPRGVVLASELVGLTEAIGLEAGALWRTGKSPVRLGVPEDAKAAVIAAIAADGEGTTLLVASTPAKALALAEEIGLFAAGFPVLRLPERELLPYEFARDDDMVRVERGRALAALQAGRKALVVASWASLSEHSPGPETLTQGFDLRVGGRQGPLALVSALEAIGYEVGEVAERQGSVARHGGVVDVFPAGAEHPSRVEFFGDEIESIRRVDIATQRSVERLESLHAGPAGTGTPEARLRARALLENLEATGEGSEDVIQQLALVAEGNRTDYTGFFEALLFDSTALDHIAAGTRLVLDDEDDGAEALSQLLAHQAQARAEHEDRGAIPRGFSPLNADVATVREGLARVELQIHLQRFGDEAFGAKRLPMRASPAFAGKLRVLVQQAGAWAKQGKAVVIATQQALRLADLMDEEGIATQLMTQVAAAPQPGTVTLAPVAAGGGFVVGEDLVFITDAEVFGFRKRRRPTRTRHGLKSDLVATLEPGDYLVHADHGIARFGGMVRRTTDGVTREYLELQYAEGDRLLVPADQLDAVSQYVGPTDRPPALTRLGSQEWARAKRRVRQSVLELAQDLVELYAKREVAHGFAFPPDTAWQMEMEAAFPFVETPDQVLAIAEVKVDMEQPRPMDRLICGDVGYGKTEVAIRAAFKAVTAGKQVAVLVPTTVLAEQHGHTFRERTAGFPIRVEVLSRFRSHEEQQQIVQAIATGEVDIAIGTHRLIQKDVHYKDLGLVIIDEEQRFGVSHKEQLKKMREEVDVLTLSATPIPRTLQMSLVGIRDMSTVMSPPEERTPIRTYVTEWDNEVVREAILRELERGGQVYFVHNRVHGIERILARLRELVPEARIAVGHGQMPEEQLERVMAEFGAGDHDVLLCTTIIESGLDIPNVNTIIINDANRLGLAQLYQLRGRVGRGANRAYAYLLYDRTRAISEAAQKRLQAIFEATELGAGFQIALRDLEIRGAGNVLGTAQSGHIAAVGFDMYAKLVADAVNAVKQVFRPAEIPPEPPLPPPPSIDLPLSAHIPETYIEEMHSRLAVYQRVSQIESAAEVSAMQEELRDRYGPVPPAVEHLLYVALVRAVARRGRVESIQTSEQMLHVRGRSGITDGQRARVEGLGLQGVIVGPNQVRIDRLAAGEGWMPLLVRVLRAMVLRE